MLKRIFITGLAALVPIVITIYVVLGLFSFADKILGESINKLLLHFFGYKIPGLAVILSLLIIFAVGFIVHLSRKRFFRWIEHAFLNIPLVNKIYSPVKNIVDFILFPPKKTYKSVVLAEYPRKGMYSLGFVMKEGAAQFNEKTGKKIYNVFIPNIPSPLTGVLVLVAEEDLIFLDINKEEAIKLIISGGLINPDD